MQKHVKMLCDAITQEISKEEDEDLKRALELSLQGKDTISKIVHL